MNNFPSTLMLNMRENSYLCRRKAASRHNCSSKLGKFCSRFAFALQRILVYSLDNECCATLRIIEMKTMKHTTKTNHKLLSLNDLEGIGFAVTSSFIYRYRAFRRCQTRAQAEGFVRFRPPDADVLAHCQ